LNLVIFPRAGSVFVAILTQIDLHQGVGARVKISFFVSNLSAVGANDKWIND